MVRVPLSIRHEGARVGFAACLRETYAGVPGEPLPLVHIDLLLALRRREREQGGQKSR